jgi:hypothetical protein
MSTDEPIEVEPRQWSRCVWDSGSFFVMAYPNQPSVERQGAATDLFESWRYLLPCPTCRRHWTAYIDAHPPIVTSRMELIKWFVTARNDVRTRTDPLARAWSVQSFIAFMTHVMFPDLDETKKRRSKSCPPTFHK